MNIIDSVSDKRFFIGDPVTPFDEAGKNNGLSVWYTNPYTTTLLHVNTGMIRQTKGKKPPIIIQNIAYELRYSKNTDPGSCTLRRTDLKQNVTRKYDIPNVRMSLENGFRIAVDGNRAVLVARDFAVDEHSEAKVILVEFTFEDCEFDSKDYDSEKVIIEPKVLDIDVSESKFNITKMDIQKNLELVAISTNKKTTFFEVSSGNRRSPDNIEKEFKEDDDDESE